MQKGFLSPSVSARVSIVLSSLPQASHLYSTTRVPALSIQQANDIALQIVNIGIEDTVVADLRRTALSIVGEVQVIFTYGHVHNQLAVELLVRLGTVDNLVDTQTVVVVFELHGCAELRHLLELAASLPCIRPDTTACPSSWNHYYNLLRLHSNVRVATPFIQPPAFHI